jgi:hypothetical protein
MAGRRWSCSVTNAQYSTVNGQRSTVKSCTILGGESTILFITNQRCCASFYLLPNCARSAAGLFRTDHFSFSLTTNRQARSAPLTTNHFPPSLLHRIRHLNLPLNNLALRLFRFFDYISRDQLLVILVHRVAHAVVLQTIHVNSALKLTRHLVLDN